MSETNGESADWFGQGGQNINDMNGALAVARSQLEAIKFGWRAMMEIQSLAHRRMLTCEAIFGGGSVKVAHARGAYLSVENVAFLYEELVDTLEVKVMSSIESCIEDDA